METRIIYVSRQGNSFNLRLRDSEGHDPGNNDITTLVDSGDIVQWVLDPNANPPAQPGYFPIASIEGIFNSDPNSSPKYRGSIQLLTGDPTKVDGVWTGYVLSPSPGSGKFENYAINYTVPGDPTIRSDDPRIQVN